jgi:hypothetical protein
LNDLREGYGELSFNDGSIYKGEWKKGKQNGKGMIIDASKNIAVEGEWKNGEKI